MVHEANPMRLARKAWNHLGLFTREEAVKLLEEKMVSQKRHVLMKDCVRIIYYCHVKRSSGCRYEMSVCVPNNPEEKLRIDDFCVHTCNPDSARVRRKAKPQIGDFSKPLEKRKPSASSTAHKGESPLPFPLGDPMPSFFASEGDRFEAENAMESGAQQRLEHDDHEEGPSGNLARFLSEMGDRTEQAASTSQSSASTVWSTVDIDIVDFTKRPDPPFTYVFHAKDEASQYSYAFPMIGNQPEVVADALLNLFYLFGPSKAVKLEPSYRGTVLETMLSEKFPSTRIVYYSENRSKQGAPVPRREESMIRERIYAWLMDNGKVNWFNHLNEIKHMHNSEWIDELGGTPMELFFGRSRLSNHNMSGKMGASSCDDDVMSDTHSNNTNETNDLDLNVPSLETPTPTVKSEL
ncbi:unnamed protein product [Cylicocyclus nassatus]|uniref:Uncharacterized protein n=1 Tax=Cylicocyclus nassatus TaxID=53992 RepID=A0AA36GL86_CYLNA|nr:unnamed protein product [Cylicocyclus nassatus]